MVGCQPHNRRLRRVAGMMKPEVLLVGGVILSDVDVYFRVVLG
jgi:hypothetical protein